MPKTAPAVASLVLLLALAACQSAVRFRNAALDANDRNFETVSGLLAKPDGAGPFPAVVILHSCGGFISHVTHDWPNYLSGLGYVVLSVDTFGTRGYARCPNPLWRASATFVKDAYGALDYLAAQPFVDKNRIAVMGFSLGANYVNSGLIPRRPSGGPDFKAAIGVYGHCTHIRSYPEGAIPLMQIAAELDPHHVVGCRSTARIYPAVEIHIIPGAYHGFDSLEASGKTGAIGERMQYSWEATVQARELVTAFLARHLGRRAGP